MSRSVLGGWPVLYDAQIQSTSSGANFEPGAIFLWRGGTGRAEAALVQYVQMDNGTCSQGEALVQNFATLGSWRVKAAATADEGTIPRGVAAASLGSLVYGFMIIAGYCEKADLSHTAASGEYLMVSGSTAGKLTPNRASVYNAGTHGSSSMFLTFAVSRTAIATGVGSIQILGQLW